MKNRISVPLPLPLWIPLIAILGVVGGCLSVQAEPKISPKPNNIPVHTQSFLQTSCIDCHDGPEGEAGFDIRKVLSNGIDLQETKYDPPWARIIDRVMSGEMPPREADQPNVKDRNDFVSRTSQWLQKHQKQRDRTYGRVRARRLTRMQVERSLHEILGIDIPLAEKLPEEGRPRGFTTVAEYQTMSHHHLARHLAVVDEALDEAFRCALNPVDICHRDLEPQAIARSNPRRRCREPEMLKGQAVVWSSTMAYYGRIPATAAPTDGWYQFRISCSGINVPQTDGIWTAIHSGPCISTAPILTAVKAFEVSETPTVVKLETWLPKGHMLEIRPQDSTVKRARFRGGQVGVGEGEPQKVPGIGIDEIRMRQVHRYTVKDVQQRLFGSVELEETSRNRFEPLPKKPRQVLAELIHSFSKRAFRRNVEHKNIVNAVSLASNMLSEGRSFVESLRAGYRTILCSPEFLYLKENPGRLNDYAIASRLSYFLTGCPPDDTLQTLAETKQLSDAGVRRQQVDRLLGLDDKKKMSYVGRDSLARQFVKDFSAEWLDLDQLDFTQPDRKLYRNYDPIVRMAMLDETHEFLVDMVLKDRPVKNLVAADYTYLNSRLCRYYKLEQDVDQGLQKVDVLEGSHRGGLLTQGAILKVTANGSTTSPVVRGAWVAERILGMKIPPPPEGVPAIEPDIRGAVTIREKLAKHSNDESCASCHRQMDPFGFAMESFDPAGQWRSHYLAVTKGRTKLGAEVEASGQLPDGQYFSDIDELKRVLASQPEKIARGLASHLIVYGTGGELSFSDRQAIDQIVTTAQETEYGFRSLLKSVVTSPLFVEK
ncbi:MAG: DUF1588 domain-containing protein [Pirellulales bacterium]